jgi:hypothetical protein
VLRAIAFIASISYMMSAATAPCFADDQGAKQQQTAPAKPDKQDLKSRGLKPNPSGSAVAPGAMAPIGSPKGDNSTAEDTLGGLPGHSNGAGTDKHP